jgi:hypothetical protein
MARPKYFVEVFVTGGFSVVVDILLRRSFLGRVFNRIDNMGVTGASA